MAATDTAARIRRPAAIVMAVRANLGAGSWTKDATALTVIVAALLVIGLVMSFSASIVDAAETGNAFSIFQRQLLWATVGVPVFILAASLDPKVWRPLSWLMMGASIVGLILVLTPLGLSEAGSTRWIAIGPLIIQPSELAKLSTVLWLSDVIARKRDLRGELPLNHLLVPALPVFGFMALLVMLEPDLGTTVLLGMVVFLVLFLEGLPWRVTGAGVLLGGVLIAGLAVAAPYRLRRITGWLAPEEDPLGTGYQLLQSLYALGDGGWFGVGLGSSRGKWNYIPNPETDFIYAIIGEELGLIGALFVLGLFIALLIVGLRVANATAPGFRRTVAFTIIALVTGQALVNVGAVTGLLPITGVTLPLVSVGGSSLVSTLAALGIVVAISRNPGTPPAARSTVRNRT